MPDDTHFRRLEHMYDGAPVNAFFQPTIRIERGTAQIRLPLRPDFFHAAGAVHGSVYFKVLDDAAFFAVASLVEDVFVLTVNYTIYFTRPVSAGVVTGTGRVVHESRRLFLAESVLVDSDGREVARGSGTFMRSTAALTPEIGYRD